MDYQDIVNSRTALNYFVTVTYDPSITATFAVAGTIALGVGTGTAKGKLWQKQDEGLSTNWNLKADSSSVDEFKELIDCPSSYVGQGGKVVRVKATQDGLEYFTLPSPPAIINEFKELIDCPSSYVGQGGKVVAVKAAQDGLEFIPAGGGGSEEISIRWFDIRPKNGKVLPVTQPRAYYPSILYNATPMFFDGTILRKYVAYYGAAASGQGYAAFSDDGVTWNNETLVTGVTGVAYHASAIVISGVIHLFYWQGALIYTPASIRHATFNPAVSCVAAVTDNPLSGTYITGLVADGLRYGTYGPDQIFYNAAPTNNPANPYSYAWCMIHNGVGTGTNEGILFATSADGLNFSAYNGLVEVVPRGVAPAWDQCIGNLNVFIDTNNLWHGFYSGGVGTPIEDSNFAGGLGYVTSIDGITWTKYQLNPIIRKTESMKTWKRLYTPWIIKDAAGYKMYFSCKSNAGTYVTAYATLAGFI